MSNMIGYVVFTDLKGFSKMNEPETFYEHTIRPLAKNLKKYKYKAEVWNTWGDALVAVFVHAIDAVELMIEYRDYFRKNKLLALQPRIAGHYGEMLLYNDPLINNMDNVLGDTVNKAARIEPITFPGEIYVSEEFIKKFIEEKEKAQDSEKERYNQMRFTDLKEWELPKNAGKIHLYRLFHESEEAWNINSLFVKNDEENIDHLFDQLNIGKVIKEAREHSVIVQAKQKNSKEEIDKVIKSHFQIPEKNDQLNWQVFEKNQNEISGPLYIALAELYKNIGEYKLALNCINNAQKWSTDMSLNDRDDSQKNKPWTSSLGGVTLQPFSRNNSILKLKADILSKDDKYQEAKLILVDLLQQDPTDTEVLTKLAAQLKREAFNIDTKVKQGEKDEQKELLEEALYLYLEAFRRNRDYYSAINASYIESILDKSNGWHLASYIFNTWNHETGRDWWLDSTLAETQLLQGEFQFCYQRMERAVMKHNPPFFERHATRDQISNYIKIVHLRRNKIPTDDKLRHAALLSILLYNPKLVEEYKEKIINNRKNQLENIFDDESEKLYKIIVAKNEELMDVFNDVFGESKNNDKEEEHLEKLVEMSGGM